MHIKIDSKTIRSDPNLVVYEIELQTDRGVWRETYGSKFEVERFLRGVEASYEMITGGYLSLPLVPNRGEETTESYTPLGKETK